MGAMHQSPQALSAMRQMLGDISRSFQKLPTEFGMDKVWNQAKSIAAKSSATTLL